MSDIVTPEQVTSSAGHGHPAQAVRHSYPLAIEDAGLSTAVGLLMKTMPYALARFGILLAVSVGTIISSAACFTSSCTTERLPLASFDLSYRVIC